MSSTGQKLGNVYVLTCGCEVEFRPISATVISWVPTRRCLNHPPQSTDPIPVYGMWAR